MVSELTSAPANGTKGPAPYNVPEASADVLAYLASDPRLNIPPEVQRIAASIKFEGTADPILPVPFKFAEAMAGLKGLEAAFVAAIAQQRYSLPTESITINTDLAALFVTSAFTTRLNGHMALDHGAMKSLITDTDIHDSYKHPWRQLCTNIYRTKTGKYYHLHGSLHALASMNVVGLDHSRIDNKDRTSILQQYEEAVGNWDPEELDIAVNDGAKQAGVICYSWDEFTNLEQGKAIINCPIYELHVAAPSPPVPWPKGAGNGALSGLKVLELTRIIAGPAVGRGLAEHGATVLRIVSSNLPDLMTVHPAMNQGKYVANLDLKTEAGKARLNQLVVECDVFIDGFRPGALDRLGYSRDAVRKLAPRVVYVRENTYGWHGPWASRSGWQQIADGLVGVADAFGRRLGLGDERGVEPVVPLFPNADFGCGEAGVLGVLQALYLRSTGGGVYDVDIALAYYNLLIMHLGEYDEELWSRIRPTVPLTHNSEMTSALPTILPSLAAKYPTLFTSEEYWETLPAPSFGKGAEVTAPRSAVRIDGLKIGSDRGPVQNGSDPAEWPAV